MLLKFSQTLVSKVVNVVVAVVVAVVAVVVVASNEAATQHNTCTTESFFFLLRCCYFPTFKKFSNKIFFAAVRFQVKKFPSRSPLGHVGRSTENQNTCCPSLVSFLLFMPGDAAPSDYSYKNYTYHKGFLEGALVCQCTRFFVTS